MYAELTFNDDRAEYDAEFDRYAEDRETDREPTTWDMVGASWGNQVIGTWGGE